MAPVHPLKVVALSPRVCVAMPPGHASDGLYGGLPAAPLPPSKFLSPERQVGSDGIGCPDNSIWDKSTSRNFYARSPGAQNTSPGAVD